jgi:hypothetical protein
MLDGEVEIEAYEVAAPTSTSIQKFTLTIYRANQAPEITRPSAQQLVAKQGEEWLLPLQVQDADHRPDEVSLALVEAPEGMTLEMGRLRWQPKTGDVGLHGVVVRASDPLGGEGSLRIALRVEEENHPPQLLSTPLTGATLGEPYLYTIRAFDPNPQDALIYTLKQAPTGAQLHPTGLLWWQPSTTGSFPFSVEARDRQTGGLTATQSWTVEVFASNQRPRITSQAPVEVTQDTAYLYTLQAEDADASDSLQAILEEAPAGMGVHKKTSRSFEIVWQPRAPDVGKHRIVVRVDDGRGGVAYQRYILEVLDKPDAPFFLTKNPPTYAWTGRLYQTRLRAGDPDKGERLRFVPLRMPQGMRLDEEQGWLYWTPEAADAGRQHEVEISVEDSLQQRPLQSLRFQVRVFLNAVTPIFSSYPPSFSLTEGVRWSHRMTASLQGASLRYRIEDAPLGVVVDEQTGEVRWTPSRTDRGSHRVILEASDERGSSARAILSLEVVTSNQPPIFDSRLSQPSQGAMVGALYSYHAVARDPEGEAVRYALEDAPSGMSFDETTGWIVWTPQAGDEGRRVRFFVLARDPQGLTARQEVIVEVSRKNTPPKMQLESLRRLRSAYILPAGQMWELLLPTATDADGDTLRYLLEDAPEGLALSTLKETQSEAYLGRVSWEPRRRDVGMHSLQIRVDDDRGGVFRFRISLEVQPPANLSESEQPSFQSEPPAVVMAGQSWRYQARIQEYLPLAGSWRYTLAPTAPQGMTVDVTTGALLWIPTPMQAGAIHEFLLTATKEDAQGHSLATLSQSLAVWVEPPLQAPKMTAPSPLQGTQEQVTSFWIEAETTRAEEILFSSIDIPEGASLGERSGVFRWRTQASDVGTHSLALQGLGSLGLATTLQLSLQIADRNDPPRILSWLPWGAVVGGALALPLVADDPLDKPADMPFLWNLLVSSGASLDTTGASPVLRWTPQAADSGRRLLLLEVEDSRGASATQWSVVTVTSQNQPPRWKRTPAVLPAREQAQAGVLWMFSLQAEDDDGDPLFYRLKNAPEGMQVSQETGLLVWRPSLEQGGAFSVEACVFDGRGGELCHPFGVDVQGGRRGVPRFLTQPPNSIQAGSLYVYPFRVAMPTTATPLVTLAQAPAGMFYDAQAQALRWQIPAEASGLYAVTLTVAAPTGEAASQRFLISVVPQMPALQWASTPSTLAQEGKPWWYLPRLQEGSIGEIRFSLTEAPEGMQIDAQSGLLSWLPTGEDARKREHRVGLRASLRAGTSIVQQFTVSVEGRLRVPVFLTAGCPEAVAGRNYNCVIRVLDAQRASQEKGNWLLFRLLEAPSGMQIPSSIQGSLMADGTTVGTILLQWAPRNHQVGVFPVVLEARNNEGLPSLLSFSLHVSNQEAGPIAHAGEDLVGIFPQEIELDGSQSLAPDDAKTPLRYQWTSRKTPEGTPVLIEEPQSRRARVILRRAGDYLFDLVVRSDERESLPDLIEVSVRNIRPDAAVDAPLRVLTPVEGLPRKLYTLVGYVGQEVTMDARPSSDSNGDPLRFQWRQLRDEAALHEAPAVSLQGEQLEIARFTPQAPGLYRFLLQVEDIPAQSNIPALQHSAWVEVVVHEGSASSPIFLPHAVVIAPERGTLNEALSLDGRRSLAPTGEITSYLWRLLESEGQAALTVEPQRPAMASLVAALPGAYQIGLVVESRHEGKRYRSQEQFVTIWVEGRSAVTQLPIAIASSGHALLERWHQLDASRSLDPSGGQLTFRWLQIEGSPVALRDEKSARPSFFVLHQGDYRFRLWVRSNQLQEQSSLESAPVDILIRVHASKNQPPIAAHRGNLSGERSVDAGSLLPEGSLEAEGSQDPEGEPLQYRWRLVKGFPLPLQTPRARSLRFLPPFGGIWVFALDVFDGKAWSLPVYASVVVNDAQNQIPVADAGADQVVSLQESVRLDGSKSYDKDPQDTLTYHWRLIEPQGIILPLNTAEPATPSFRAEDPKIQRYLFGLRVDDGKHFSLESRVTVEVRGINQSPVAVIQRLGSAYVGEEITLDGSKSYDPDEQSLSFQWKQIEGAPIQAKDWTAARLSFQVEAEGSYTFQLQVSDPLGATSAPDTLSFQARPRPFAHGCGCRFAPSSPELSPLLLLLLLLSLRCLRRR